MASGRLPKKNPMKTGGSGKVFHWVFPHPAQPDRREAIQRMDVKPAPERNLESIVFIIDDDAPLREALGSLLRSIGLRVELFGSVADFMQYQRPDLPSCLVLDVRLQGTSGLVFQQALADANIHLPIIFMTGYGDIAMTVRAMKAGAVDFLEKPFREQAMIDAVVAAHTRDRSRRECERRHHELRTRHGTLTIREQAVMALAVSGLINKQIASAIGLSEITVKIHRSQAMRKMRAQSFADLVRMAESLGINH